MVNPFGILKYQLYLLQLENYELGRYWTLLFKKGIFPPKELRKGLVWTSKAKGIFLIALGLYLLSIALSFFSGSWIVMVLSLILPVPFYFVLYSIACLILLPLDLVLKYRIVRSARQKIKKLPQLKIIGIAGSYGKTTMKQVLETVLKEKLNVLSTPESVNTPIGIGRWILREVSAATEVIIIEMGEHYQGDIAQLCKITPPDIAVLTGINEAHLERLGSLQNSIVTMFELIENSKPHTMIFLNADDEHIVDTYPQFTKDMKISFYSHENNTLAEYNVQNQEFHQDGSGISFELVGQDRAGESLRLQTALLGEYSIGTIMAAVLIAKHLGLSPEEVKKGVSHIQPVQHRLQPIRNQDLLVIDDSYNGNPDGVREAIKVLSQFRDKRKVYLTPGLVEMGKRSREVHIAIGEQLAKVADLVILIKNSVTPFIAQGLQQEKFPEEKILWFDTAPEAHAVLSKILQSNDVILFQNDWGDNYV